MQKKQTTFWKKKKQKQKKPNNYFEKAETKQKKTNRIYIYMRLLFFIFAFLLGLFSHFVSLFDFVFFFSFVFSCFSFSGDLMSGTFEHVNNS